MLEVCYPAKSVGMTGCRRKRRGCLRQNCWLRQSACTSSCAQAVRVPVAAARVSCLPQTSRWYWRPGSHLKHETLVAQTHTLAHDEVVGESAKVRLELDISNRCQPRGPLLCEWSVRKIGSFASLSGRGAASGQERRCARSKSAERIWELGRAATIAMSGVMMCVDVLCSPKTCFEAEMVVLCRIFTACGYNETDH